LKDEDFTKQVTNAERQREREELKRLKKEASRHLSLTKQD